MWAIQKTPVPTPTKPPVSFYTVTLLMCPYASVPVGCPEVQLGSWWCLLPFTQKTDEVWEPLSSSPTALLCHVCFTYSHHWVEDEQHELLATSHPKMQPVGDATYLSCNKPFNNIFPVYECKLMVSVHTGDILTHIPLPLQKKTNKKKTSKNCRKG